MVAYAESRYITIIPEIEMPAHSEEVLTAYPELSCTHEPISRLISVWAMKRPLSFWKMY